MKIKVGDLIKCKCMTTCPAWFTIREVDYGAEMYITEEGEELSFEDYGYPDKILKKDFIVKSPVNKPKGF